MDHKKITAALRIAGTALLAAVLLISLAASVPQARAREASLRVRRETLIRWRRGLPPRDGGWYHVLLIDAGTGKLLLGDSHETITDAEWSFEQNGGEFLRLRGADEPEGNSCDAASLPWLDPGRDVFYSQNYANTPALRFEEGAGTGGFEPSCGNAPYYDLELSDWSAGGGQMSGTGLQCDPESLRDADGQPLYSFHVSGDGSPWFFVSHDNLPEAVPEGQVRIGRPGGAFLGVRSYLLHTGNPRWSAYDQDVRYGDISALPCLFSLRGGPESGDAFYIYYADEIRDCSILDGQVIDDGQVVRLSGEDFYALDEGRTITVTDGGVLLIDSGLYNDGAIRVEAGGTLIVGENAFLMPWDTERGTGNVVCAGGDVIIRAGARVVCEGASGFKFTGFGDSYGSVYNDGVIITNAFTATGQPGSFHNNGAVMYGWTVSRCRTLSFREDEMTISGGQADLAGLKPGEKNCLLVTDGVIQGNPIA